MIVVVGQISAVYSGRGETHLAPYKRIVMVKTDGSVSIHGEKGYKPMNYMTASKGYEESLNASGEKIWTFATKKESLTITFHEIFDTIELPLGLDDPGYSSKLGQEKQLQEWLVEKLPEVRPGYQFKEREYQTGDGPVDLLAEETESGALVAVEVKRTTTLNTVGQVLRYADALRLKHPERLIKAAVAAVTFKDSTLTLAAKKGVECLQVPETWAEDYRQTHEELASTVVKHEELPGTVETPGSLFPPESQDPPSVP